MKFIGKQTILALPPAPTGNDRKWADQREKLRQKKQKYLEGLKKFMTKHEAMLYAGIRSRGTLILYRKNDPDFERRENEAIYGIEKKMIDVAKKGLFLEIGKGNLKAIKYFLDRKCPEFMPKKRNINEQNQEQIEEALDIIKMLSNGNNKAIQNKQSADNIITHPAENI